MEIFGLTDFIKPLTNGIISCGSPSTRPSGLAYSDLKPPAVEFKPKVTVF